MLDDLFQLKSHQTTVTTEILAGLTTFLTMAYIIFVNPQILGRTGMDPNAVFVATCLAAAVGCLIMGLYANLPVSLAPGMGLNAFFTFTVVLGMHQTWQVALGCVFISGVLFVLVSLLRLREWLINAIPATLKKSIAAGIGGFLAIIAMQEAGIVMDNPATLIALGDLTGYIPAMSLFCFFLILTLQHLKIPGGVLIAMLIVSGIAVASGHTHYYGLLSTPPSIAPTFLQMDIIGALSLGMVSVIFAFFFVDLFDTAGTLIGVTGRARLSDKDGRVPNLKKALLADSGATVIGAALGTSNTTCYIESAAGVSVGGRTGLTNVVVAFLFLCALFFSPLAAMVPIEATSGAILYVAVLMMYALGDIDWNDVSEAAPAAMTVFGMPFFYSIADGITLGFITYTVIKLLTGKARSLNISVWLVTLILLGRLFMMATNFTHGG